MTYLGADGRQYVVISAGGDGEILGKGGLRHGVRASEGSLEEDSRR